MYTHPTLEVRKVYTLFKITKPVRDRNRTPTKAVLSEYVIISGHSASHALT